MLLLLPQVILLLQVELFARPHNCGPNWLSLGNQLDGVNLHDPELKRRYHKRYEEKIERLNSNS